jgi:hypothetical protein
MSDTKPAPDYLAAAKLNLNAPDGITIEQYAGRAAAALAQATIALVEAQQTANLLAYLNVASQYRLAYVPSENILKSVQADVETRLGLA